MTSYSTDIQQVRHFNVTVTLHGNAWPVLSATSRRCPLRVERLTFRVDAEGSRLALSAKMVMAEGRNIRANGSIGAPAYRYLWADVQENAWAMEHAHRVMAEIAARPWPELDWPED